MPYLLDSICTITGVFYEHAKRHGDSSTLNKREMKRLILKEFADVIENPHDRKTVELTFQILDANGDGLVDFNEYLLLILKVAEACYSPLKPREDCLGEIERSTAECGEEQRQNNRDQVEDNARTGRSIRERGDSDQRYLPPTEGTEREQERRNYHPLEPEAPVEERSHQDLERRDRHGRDRPSHEPQEVEDGQTYWYGQQHKSEAWYHQIRQVEKDCQRWSRDLLPRNEKERQRDERQHQEVRTERRDNYPEDVETQYEIGPHDTEGRIDDDEQRGQICRHDPLGEYDSLPREDKRRSWLNDSEWEQRRNETRENDRRARPSDSTWRGGHRAERQDEPELRDTEWRRIPIRDQDGWTPSDTCQPRRREEEEEDHQWSESREREQIRSHSHESEPMESERRPLHSYESETRGSERRTSQWHEGEDRRRQQYHQDEVIERRRPRPLESAHCEQNRPLIYRQEDNKPREQCYEDESQERQRQLRGTQIQDADPKESDRSKPQLHYRSYERERSQLTEPQARHTDQDRSCASDGSSRDHYQRRQQSDRPAVTQRRDNDQKSNEANKDVQRQEWRYEVVPRSGELQRHSDDRRNYEQIWRSPPFVTSTTDVEQRRREAHDVSSRDRDQQMTTPFCDPFSRNVDQRQTQEHRLDARDGEQQKRTNTENRDLDQRQTQIFDKKGDEQQRRQSNSVDTRRAQQERRFSSHDIEDNIANQRRGQTHEFDQREGNHQGRSSSHNTCDMDINQGQPRTYDVNPRCGEQERRTSPYDAEGRNVNQRRMQTQNIGSRDIKQDSRFPYAGDVVQRRTHIKDGIDSKGGEQQKERPSCNTYATGIDQRQSRIHNIDIRNEEEERRNPSQDSYAIDADQVGQQDEQQRRTNSKDRDVDQSRNWICYIDPRNDVPQRRSSQHDTRGAEDRRIQTHEDGQQDEQQRWTPSRDSYGKDVDQRQSRPHAVDPRDVDQDRRVFFHDIEGRDVCHRRTQTYDSKNGEQQRRTRSHTCTTNPEQRQPITYDVDQREQRGRISTCDGREINQRRTQIHEYDQRDREQQRNSTLTRDFDQRRTQGTYRRDDGQQRQTISCGLEGRQIDQRRTQTHEIDPRDDEEQRQPHSRARDVDQRGTYEVDPRDGGQQRRTLSCDPYYRNVDHRQTQIHDDDSRDAEHRRWSQPEDTGRRASEQRGAQAPDTDTRDQGENKPSYIVPRVDERQKRTTSHNVDERTRDHRGTQICEVGLLDGNRQQRNSLGGIDVTDRRTQINEGDQRDGKEPRTTYVRDAGQRQTQRPEVDPRLGEEQRQIQSCKISIREDGQKPTQAHNVDSRNYEQERQVPPGRPKQREREQRQTQTHEIDESEPKETESCGNDRREQQRRNLSHDPRAQDANKRSTKPSEADTRDPEKHSDSQARESSQRGTAQTNKVDSRDGQHQRLSRNTEERSTDQITCTQPGDTEVWVTEEEATHGSGSRDRIRKRQGQQASRSGQSGHIQQEGEVAPKRRETRTQQKLELGATRDKSTSSLPCGPQTIGGNTGEEPNSGARTVDEPEAVQPADGEPPGTLEKQEPEVQEGDSNCPGPRERPSEEGSGEPQPPSEDEEESQLGTERPRHGAEKIPGSQELDTSQGKLSFLCEKVPPVCNPLYEYLLAQKKLEKP